MKIATYVFWAASGGFLMSVEMHTDDAGLVALLIVAIAFILGAIHPKRAWQWALLVGPCVPAAHWIFGSGISGFTAKDLLLLLAFTIALGLAGAYGGVLARKGAARLG